MATEIRTQILESETFKNLCKTSQSVHSKNGAIKQVSDAIKIAKNTGVEKYIELYKPTKYIASIVRELV